MQCGVPKKGHVCPYQPKLTRRPGEPLPEMRSAAIQVEMDEVRHSSSNIDDDDDDDDNDHADDCTQFRA